MGGDTLGPDLTFAYTRLGEKELAPILSEMSTPVMRSVYGNAPLDEDEQFALKAYRADLAPDGTVSRKDFDLLPLGLEGMAIVFGDFAVWRKPFGRERRNLRVAPAHEVSVESEWTLAVGFIVLAGGLSFANRSSGRRAETESGWPAGSTWCSRVGPRDRRSVSLWTGQTLAIDRHEELRGVPVRRRGARTGGAGRRPRVAARSHPWRAGTPPSAPAHPCSETDASVTRGSRRNRISESRRDGAHRGR